ncbi:hypothetical protein AS593_08175 [Caulobacter vibrioides]|nr:hypothetical protein AS593_08175 [Caulobacter vibrioides]
MSDATANLTGVWQGLYSYPEASAPVAFTATVLESGAWVSGSVHEVAYDEYGVAEVFATLLGRRSGASVTFTKTYDGSGGWNHDVLYAGTVSDDGTEVEGSWSIPGVWSGKFLMIRSQGPREASLRQVFETLSV